MTTSTLSISFEFFPPKTPEGEKKLLQTAIDLQKFQPEFFSVTYGAGGSARQGTVDTINKLRAQIQVPISPHLACVGSTKDEMLACIHSYQALGVKQIVALRGDIPQGVTVRGDFHYASELVELIRTETGNYFQIVVAAYPEVHPQAVNPQGDILNLKRKWEAGANRAITQYFFNPDAYFYYLEACHKHSIEIPIIPGIMPITHFNKLAQFSATCGAEIPLWLRKRLEEFGDDQEAASAFGVEVVTQLCDRLIQGGAPGLHFYTLNNSDCSKKILQALGMKAAAI